jgi:hypothetical protein
MERIAVNAMARFIPTAPQLEGDIDLTVQVPLADLPPGPPEWLPPGHLMSNFPPR